MLAPDFTIDPAISLDDVAAAHDATPHPFPELTDRHQDDIYELGSGATKAASPAQAIANAHRLSVGDTYVGIGYCLRTVRSQEFLIGALFPSAEDAWDGADLKHPETDPNKIPRGAVPFWTNGRNGHVALSAGGGMCWTTDYRRPGYVDLAPIASLASWCGGRLVGWAEDVNGVDVWPNERPRRLFGLDDRIVVVENALRRAKGNNAPQHRIDGLKEWLAQLEAKKATKP